MTHITIGAEKVSLEKPVVMGILNVTPDSFYDGGKYTSELKIMERVDEIVEQGAGIIDVGAYSTRPGAAFVDTQEELSRLSFALELIRKYHPHLPVSIDTFRADVAKEISHCLGPGNDTPQDEVLRLYQNYFLKAKELMLAKNHDYDEAWREMRVSSYTDLILMKINRTKQIEDHQGTTIISEGIDANYFDMVNYAVFGLIRLVVEQE